MPVSGLNFDRISVERTNEPAQQVNIKNNLFIKDVKEQELQIGEQKKTVLRFDFEFSIAYEPKVGSIVIGGHVIYLDENNKIKDVTNNWKKKKEVEPKLMEQVLNVALYRCTVKALDLAQELNLPAHMRMPRIKTSQDTKNYIG